MAEKIKEPPPEFEVIAPVDFQPSQAPHRRGLAGISWWTISSVGLLLLLAAVATYVFTGRSVLISVEPAPEELALDGALIPLKFGDRWLLHPGNYRVEAVKAGYEPLDTTFVVDEQQAQEFSFQLVKLPGYLSVTADGVAGAHVYLDGQPVSAAPMSRLELREGEYELVVRAPRYHDFAQTVTMEGALVEQQVAAELQPAWADVELNSEPAGATLYVDGEPVGETPLVAQIVEGERQVELQLDGYKPWDSSLQLTAGTRLSLPLVELELADSLIAVASVPAGASVTVNGEYRGQTPMQLALPPGQSYRFGFAKAGYRSNQRVVDVVKGDETRLQVQLQPILGEVQVSGTPGDAEVYVDGVFQGRLNESFRLAAHPRRIEVRAEGYQPFSTTVTPNPEQQQLVNVALVSFSQAARARNPDILVTSTGYRLKQVQPAGVIRLGSPRREQGRRANEFLRQVQLDRPFYIGLTEVTNAEFRQFLSSHDSGVVETATLSLADQPAVRVTWNQAARFCNWLSEKEGLKPAYRLDNDRMLPVKPMTNGYRLPTEAEWVYVARYEGSSRAALKYPWGENMPPPPASGNYAGVESNGIAERPLANYRDDFPATAQVGGFPANALGLYDLGGNVREWMHDFYQIVATSQGSIPVNPMGSADGTDHVVRGSSWRSGSISELRLAYRDQGSAGRDDIGFRVARYIDSGE